MLNKGIKPIYFVFVKHFTIKTYNKIPLNKKNINETRQVVIL